MRCVSREATHQQKANFREKLTAVLTPLAEEAMDWGKVGAVLGLDENLSWDLRIQLTGVDTKQELWEGISKLVLEAKYKEQLDAVDKSMQRNVATKEVPDWAMKFKALPQSNSTNNRTSLLPQGQGIGRRSQHAQAYQQMTAGNANQTGSGSQSPGQGNFMAPPPVHVEQMQSYPGPHTSCGQSQAEQAAYTLNPIQQWTNANHSHSLLVQGAGPRLSHTHGGQSALRSPMMIDSQTGTDLVMVTSNNPTQTQAQAPGVVGCTQNAQPADKPKISLSATGISQIPHNEVEQVLRQVFGHTWNITPEACAKGF